MTCPLISYCSQSHLKTKAYKATIEHTHLHTHTHTYTSPHQNKVLANIGYNTILYNYTYIIHIRINIGTYIIVTFIYTKHCTLTNILLDMTPGSFQAQDCNARIPVYMTPPMHAFCEVQHARMTTVSTSESVTICPCPPKQSCLQRSTAHSLTNTSHNQQQ